MVYTLVHFMSQAGLLREKSVHSAAILVTPIRQYAGDQQDQPSISLKEESSVSKYRSYGQCFPFITEVTGELFTTQNG